MSSSSPHDPRREPGYTATPPAAVPNAEAADERDVPLPKLGSLAQKARSKHLKQARTILFVIGILTILVNAGLIVVSLANGGDETVVLVSCAIHGLFLCLGILFVIFGAIIYRFPVMVTITSLTLYVGAWGLEAVIALLTDPLLLGRGVLWKIIFTVPRFAASVPSP